MHNTKPQPTKETKAEEPKTRGPEMSAPYSNNLEGFKKTRKKKKKDQHNRDWH